MSNLSPLSGVKRKLDFGAVRAAFDPYRKSAEKFPARFLLGASAQSAPGRAELRVPIYRA